MRAPLFLALLAGLSSLASCAAGGHSVNLYGGVRQLGDSDLEDLDLDGPVYYGVDGVLALDNDGLVGLGIEGGIGHSDDDDGGAEIDLDEIYGGLRLSFPMVPIVKPYVSGGVTRIDGTFDDGAGGDADDDGFSPYLRGGAALQFGLFRFGADVRYVFDGSVDLDEAEVEGWVPTLFIGLAF